MSQVLVFSGTTEGRELAERLADTGISCEVCVATDYGGLMMEPHGNIHVCCGRMDADAMRRKMEQGDFLAVADATHPYATEVSENIKRSAAAAGLPYLRVKRTTEGNCGREADAHLFSCGWQKHASPGEMVYVRDAAECERLLELSEGNILLTTGTKDLSVYSQKESVRSRLYVRVLPAMESLALCSRAGICGKQVIAMQGPFLAALNEALLRQFDIAVMVTKESGEAGGFSQKREAAERAGIPLIVIENPDQTSGGSPEEVYQEIRALAGEGEKEQHSLQISLVGAGMGSLQLLTGEALAAIREAEILFGAKRLLASQAADANPSALRIAKYRADEILSYLRESTDVHRVAVLFSGDTGFYSGAGRMAEALQKEKERGGFSFSYRILPGISSVCALAARIGTSWQDARILSIHGREADVVAAVRYNPKVFLLVSGLRDMHWLGEELGQCGLSHVRIHAGYALSQPDEAIRELKPEECGSLDAEGLYTCLIENGAPERKILTPGMADSCFVRGNVPIGNVPMGNNIPMTKEEVREISLCKLQLYPNAVLYDVGSGTGSIAVEAAKLSDTVSVWAIEQKEEARQLIEENRRSAGVGRLHVVSGQAPEAFANLPMPTHAFIGGSGGRLREIIDALHGRNPKIRIVVNAVSLETIAELTAYCADTALDVDIVQVQVSRARRAGAYHLMRAENPIYICTLREGGRP